VSLHQLAADSAARQPRGLAVHGPDGELNYRELESETFRGRQC
jgi:hypothetical protein